VLTSKVLLHVEEFGSGDPTVVLLHGFGGSARNFRPQARFLAPKYRVLLSDLRGHARSAAPISPGDYELGAFVEDTRELVLRAGPPSVVLGGLSMGAAIALHYARLYPASIRGLILAAFPGADEASTSSWALRFADAIDRDGLDAAGSSFVWGGTRFDADGAKWIRQGFMEHPPHALAATLRRTLAVLPPIKKIATELSHLQVPTLLIFGTSDTSAEASSRELAATLPLATLVAVPGAGHVVNLQKPESFNAAIGEFLRGI
jgi:3-oxoadipate enol-lactonase